jgi:hypothetical protein
MRGAPMPRGYAVCFRTTLRSLSVHKGKADESADLTVGLSIYFSRVARDGDCSPARWVESADARRRSTLASRPSMGASRPGAGAPPRTPLASPPSRFAGPRTSAPSRRSAASIGPTAAPSSRSVTATERSAAASPTCAAPSLCSGAASPTCGAASAEGRRRTSRVPPPHLRRRPPHLRRRPRHLRPRPRHLCAPPPHRAHATRHLRTIAVGPSPIPRRIAADRRRISPCCPRIFASSRRILADRGRIAANRLRTRPFSRPVVAREAGGDGRDAGRIVLAIRTALRRRRDAALAR